MVVLKGRKIKTYAFLGSERAVSLFLWFCVIMEEFQHSLQTCTFWSKLQTKQECVAMYIKFLNNILFFRGWGGWVN